MSAVSNVTSIFLLEWAVLEVARCGAADSELEMVRQLGKCPHAGLLDELRGAVVVSVVSLVISCLPDIVGGFIVVSLVGSFIQKNKH